MSKLVTGKLRVSFPCLEEPNTLSEKFQLDLLIPKDSPEVKKIKKAIDEATQDGIDRVKGWNGKKPPKFFSPLKDGDEKIEEATSPEKYQMYEGMYYITPKANKANEFFLFDRQRNRAEADEFYAGCYVRASVEFFPYAHDKGGKGVSVKLTALQFIADGEGFGGGRRSEDDVMGDFDDGYMDDDEEAF